MSIFSSKEKKRGEEIIVVECKKKTRQDGITQLQDYLKFSDAALGVWFNGESTHYVKKYIKNGKISFDDNLINIPKYRNRAYVNLSHEQEAYDNDQDLDYLETRKRFAWLRYLKYKPVK